MLMLASKGAVFVGQGVCYGQYPELEGVPDDQRIEMPVAEELQLGICTGLAMQGVLPVCIYPRMDFMMRAMDQLVNHLDKIAAMSQAQWNPKMIIRTKVGTKTPLNAGPQHTQNHAITVNDMLEHVEVVELDDEANATMIYAKVLRAAWPVLVIETC